MIGRWAAAGVSLCLAACSSWKPPPLAPNYGANGPNYSSTPCVDNCGTDTQCVTHCTNSVIQAPLLGTSAKSVSPN